jgi:hypothetical protein
MRTKIIVIVVAAVVLIGLGIWAGVALVSAGQNPAGPSPYSAVYLTTGDIYFGRLSWFPMPHLTDAWVLQRTQNAQGQTQVGVAPFVSSFWGPVDEIDLSPQQIVFWTRLRNDSQLAQALANPSSVQQAGTQGIPVPSSSIPSAPTSTR